MKISGLHPVSLTDFPGKVSAVFFTVGCNMRCPFCHNKSLWKENAPIIPDKEITRFLEKRQGQLDGIVISGGEPTLQPDLAEFIDKVRSYGYLVKLDTNGMKPDIVQALLEKRCLDYIAMDIKAPFDKYPSLVGLPNVSIEKLKESIALIANSGIAHEFRTTFVPHLLTQVDLDIIKSYVPSGSFHRVQEYIEVVDAAD